MYTSDLTTVHYNLNPTCDIIWSLSDTYQMMLSQNLGAAFVPSPSQGTLMPFGEEVVDVTAFCDMWGNYTDSMTVKVMWTFCLKTAPSLICEKQYCHSFVTKRLDLMLWKLGYFSSTYRYLHVHSIANIGNKIHNYSGKFSIHKSAVLCKNIIIPCKLKYCNLDLHACMYRYLININLNINKIHFTYYRIDSLSNIL